MFFYIDTENVSIECWIHHLGKLSAKDRLYVFYSENSAKIPIQFMKKIQSCLTEIQLIHVDVGTPNALDFALVAHLARHTTTAPKTEHIIVARDTGYDAACRALSVAFGANAHRVVNMLDIFNRARRK